jgi:hypothetical protein
MDHRSKLEGMIEQQRMRNLYDSNPDFKLFCDKAIANGDAPSLDELLKRALVKEVADYYSK